MATKNVAVVHAPRPPHFVGDGFRVHNFIPGAQGLSMERMSPFIMLDYNSKFYFPPTHQPRGVDVHPHRGFETVTIAYKGKIAHHDSAGNSGIIGEGDVQWMTASSGILHKEYHERSFSQMGGWFQMVQLWVNLPARYKMSPPKYQELTADKIPAHPLADGQGVVKVIAGEYAGTKGAASTFSPVHLFNAHLVENGTAHFSFPATYNTALLVIEGNVTINDHHQAPTDHFVVFEPQGESFSVCATGGEATVLVLSGAPINEPIAAYGPFVMNTQREIQQAFEDFRAGQFGQLT